MSYFCPAMTAINFNLVDLFQWDGLCYSGDIQTSDSNGKLILEMTAFFGIIWDISVLTGKWKRIHFPHYIT